MNNHQINCFLEVAKEKNFTRAADNLYITQPAISRTISSLEKELKVTLFNRLSGRRIELTTAGNIYYDYFLSTVNSFNNAKELASKFSDPDAIQLRLGFLSAWAPTIFLSDAIDNFYEMHPHVKVSYACDDFDALYDAFLRDKYDTILTLSHNHPVYNDMIIEPIAHIQRIILYSDRFIKRYGEVSSPQDFENAVFFVPKFSSYHALNQYIRDFATPYGFKANLFETENMHTVIALVEQGEGVTFSDVWSTSNNLNNFHSIPLNTYHTVNMAWKKGKNEKYIEDLAKMLNIYNL